MHTEQLAGAGRAPVVLGSAFGFLMDNPLWLHSQGSRERGGARLPPAHPRAASELAVGMTEFARALQPGAHR